MQPPAQEPDRERGRDAGQAQRPQQPDDLGGVRP
jgi:hypothetical protein